MDAFMIGEFAMAWKADDMEKAALAKNSKAFGKQAEAKEKVRIHEEKLFDKMKLNAIRKNAILQYHIKKFLDVYKTIDEYELSKGLGIREMEKINTLREQIAQKVDLPAIANGVAKSDAQIISQYVFFGLGGAIMKDAKDNQKLASRNMANANVVSAQADSICIFYDVLTERIGACTDILQKLAARDMMALNHIETMLKQKGQNEDLYTQNDVDAINLCSELNILIYEIINTPLIDENNEITKASINIINKGKQYLSQLG